MNLENFNYYSDHRVISSMTRKIIVGATREGVLVDFGALIDYNDEPLDGYPEEGVALVDLPMKMVVCPCCDGRSTVVNPAIDAGGLSQEDFDDDPDFEERYLSGYYDITCPECKGMNVTPAIDEARLNCAAPEAQEVMRVVDNAIYNAELKARERANELKWGY
jgi:hypothetical protein